MQTYLVTYIGKLFSGHRVVQAASRAEAVATARPDQTGVRLIWVEEVTGEE